MIRSTPARLALALALVLSAAGCASIPWPWAKEREAAMACYWMTPDGKQWQVQADIKTKPLCFELDSCMGGQGMSGGGCYKWAAGADAPAQVW